MREVIDLEHDGHLWLQFNDLTTVEAEFFVVIEYSVHVFDPHCIYWTIEADPFSVGRFRLCTVPDLDSKHTVGPLLRVHIEDTVKLILGDTLRIHVVSEYINEIRIILDLAHGLLQCLDDARLATVRQTDNHKTVSYHNGLIQLDDLVNEVVCWLDVLFLAGDYHLVDEDLVVLLRQLDAREEISGDTFVEQDVVGSELGYIDIVQSLQANLVLLPVAENSP